jgi:hypothetical protein
MIGSSKIGLRPIRGGGGGAAPNPDFVSTWDTTQAGSASDTIVLPMTAGNTVDWGDGNIDTTNTHTYAAGGTYTVTISGTINTFRFANGGDKLKLIEVSNCGTLELTTSQTFYGCQNMDWIATDAPTISSANALLALFRGCMSITAPDLSSWDVSICTSMVQTFLDCQSLTTPNMSGWDVSSVDTLSSAFLRCYLFTSGGLSTWVTSSLTDTTSCFESCFVFNEDISVWDVSLVTTMRTMFNRASVFNQPIGAWTTTSLINIQFMFWIAPAFDQDLSNWDILPITAASFFMLSASGLSTVNYDATLISWDTQAPTNVLNINFGGSQYTLGGAAEAARTSLISTYGWTITDGGGI